MSNQVIAIVFLGTLAIAIAYYPIILGTLDDKRVRKEKERKKARKKEKKRLKALDAG